MKRFNAKNFRACKKPLAYLALALFIMVPLMSQEAIARGGHSGSSSHFSSFGSHSSGRYSGSYNRPSPPVSANKNSPFGFFGSSSGKNAAVSGGAAAGATALGSAASSHQSQENASKIGGQVNGNQTTSNTNAYGSPLALRQNDPKAVNPSDNRSAPYYGSTQYTQNRNEAAPTVNNGSGMFGNFFSSLAGSIAGSTISNSLFNHDHQNAEAGAKDSAQTSQPNSVSAASSNGSQNNGVKPESSSSSFFGGLMSLVKFLIILGVVVFVFRLIFSKFKSRAFE